MKILYSKYIFIVIIFFNASCHSKKIKDQKTILVTADAVKAELISENNEKYPDAAFFPMLFEVTFNNIKVKQGTLSNYKSSVKFNIETRSDYMLLNEKFVFLLIDVTDDDNHKLLEWGFVTSLICLDEKHIEQDYEDNFIKMKINEQESQRCAFVRADYEPPNREESKSKGSE